MVVARDLSVPWVLSEVFFRTSGERPNNDVIAVSASVCPGEIDSSLGWSDGWRWVWHVLTRACGIHRERTIQRHTILPTSRAPPLTFFKYHNRRGICSSGICQWDQLTITSSVDRPDVPLWATRYSEWSNFALPCWISIRLDCNIVKRRTRGLMQYKFAT